MAAAYRNGKGTMAERLMDALDAGQSKGGDTRGMQSAGILVVRPLDPKSDSTVERVVDIRVDDSPEPFKELRRLLNMTMGVPNRLMTHAAELSKAGKHAEAIAEAKKALEINPRAETTMYGAGEALCRRRRHQARARAAVARDLPAAEAVEVRSVQRSGVRETARASRVPAVDQTVNDSSRDPVARPAGLRGRGVRANRHAARAAEDTRSDQDRGRGRRHRDPHRRPHRRSADARRSARAARKSKRRC